MGLAKIVVPLTGAARDAAALATAFAAATPFNAHVAAILVHPDPRLSVPAMGAPLSPGIVQNIINAAEELNRATDKIARATFQRVAAAEGVLVVDQPRNDQSVTCSYQETEGLFADTVARVARLCDLVVFGPLAATDGSDLNHCFVEVLTKTDRAVLLAGAAPSNLTDNVVIAWDGSTAACHAVTGALPFLKKAQRVTALHIGANQQDNELGLGFATRASLQELIDYLALHGVTCNEETFEREAKITGEALLNAALSCDANLLVMGGYGHNHLREAIFGGVTAHIRWNARLPVLMVH